MIAHISPNVSVWAAEPNGDPLGLYLRSLVRLRRDLPAGMLAPPGHQLPFFGLHERCSELAAHHQTRCDLIAAACGEAPKIVADLAPVLFTRALDPHQHSFAFSETHAHVSHMAAKGRLAWGEDGGRLKARPI